MRLSFLFDITAEVFNKPKSVFLFCAILMCVGFIVDGTLYRLYGFYAQEDLLRTKIHTTELEIIELRQKVLEARNPQFLERLARERFNMVGDDELIFVFDE